MIQPPTLKDNQFAVLLCDGATGHVLNITGNVYQSDDENVFFIFEDLDSAKLFAEQKQVENDTLELIIYNHHNKPVIIYDSLK